MPLTEKEVAGWTVDSLRNYLRIRGVAVSGEGNRKADLVRKVLAASILDLPPTPSTEEKCKEISRRRTCKLTVGCIKIPFPEDLKLG